MNFFSDEDDDEDDDDDEDFFGLGGGDDEEDDDPLGFDGKLSSHNLHLLKIWLFRIIQILKNLKYFVLMISCYPWSTFKKIS